MADQDLRDNQAHLVSPVKPDHEVNQDLVDPTDKPEAQVYYVHKPTERVIVVSITQEEPREMADQC